MSMTRSEPQELLPMQAPSNANQDPIAHSRLANEVAALMTRRLSLWAQRLSEPIELPIERCITLELTKSFAMSGIDWGLAFEALGAKVAEASTHDASAPSADAASGAVPSAPRPPSSSASGTWGAGVKPAHLVVVTGVEHLCSIGTAGNHACLKGKKEGAGNCGASHRGDPVEASEEVLLVQVGGTAATYVSPSLAASKLKGGECKKEGLLGVKGCAAGKWSSVLEAFQ